MNACEKCGNDRKLNARFCSQACNRDMATARRWRGYKIEGQFDGRHCKRCTAPILRKRYRKWPEMIDKWKSRIFCGKICARAFVAAKRRDADSIIDKLGYVWIEKPTCCDLHIGRRKIQEHVMKAEHVLGRKMNTSRISLGDGEAVHHIDGNKSNNANGNLLICTNSYHRWLHNRMSVLYQQEKFA